MEYTDAELIVDGLCDIPSPPNDAESRRDDRESRCFDAAANADKCCDPFTGRNSLGFDIDAFGTTTEGAGNAATSRLIKDGNGISGL